MADVVSNYAKGKIAYLATLPAANDAFILIALKASGLVSDATLIDYADVATMLAGATDEATNSGYARKTITSSISVTTDTTNDWQTVDMPDQTWTAVATAGGAWGKLCLAYDGDTTGGTDSNLLPLIYFDFATTPDGSDITCEVNATGLLKCA